VPQPSTPFFAVPWSHRGSWLGQVSSTYLFRLAYHNSDIQISSPRRFSMLVTTWPTTLWVTESPSVHHQAETTGSSSGCSSTTRLLPCPKSSLTWKPAVLRLCPGDGAIRGDKGPPATRRAHRQRKRAAHRGRGGPVRRSHDRRVPRPQDTVPVCVLLAVANIS
jgi:hypothetical protein